MKIYESITRKELKERFPPLQLQPQPWPFTISSIKLITKRETTQSGQVVYVVQFKDGQIRKILASSLNETHKNLVDQFERERTHQSEQTTKRRGGFFESKNKSKKKVRFGMIESSDDDMANFIVNSSEEEEESAAASSSVTRSGRRLNKAVSFTAEFYPPATTTKSTYTSAYSYRVPLYTDKTFIDQHSTHCFRCNASGSIDGPLEVPVGPETRRMRLLLCKTCSYSVHNNCLPQQPISYFNTETCEFTCVKCNGKKPCDECHKSIKVNDSEISFRCNLCFRAFHRKCLKKGVSPSIADTMENQNLDKMYETGLCMECITFGQTPGAIVGERKTENGKTELLIKWKDMSYRHTNWVLESWMQGAQSFAHRAYVKKRADPNFRIQSTFPVEWTIVDRILNVEWADTSKTQVKRILVVYKDTSYEDAVWDNPPAETETELYPDYKLALDRYIQASKVKPPTGMKQLITQVRTMAKKESYEKHELKAQPEFMKGGTLMKHQLEALNWLLYQWENKQSCILADDMGLGKTIQIIGYLYTLYKRYNIFPFIIVVPNSTATNWIREFNKWAPEFTVAPFFGSAKSRKLALDNEIFDARMSLKCHVVVATYESSLEATRMHSLFWAVMVVDESQRLKNDESLLFRTLKKFSVDQITLLTGTPLQNNLKELFNIMNFIQPANFHGREAENYEEMTNANVEDLHSRLRPHFLRRTKEEVLKTLPPKYELIVPVSMTSLQKEVYKQCLSGDIHETLSRATGTKRQKGLTNIFVNLRKTLNHPYLLDGVETPQPTPTETQLAMINACGKLKLFHQMFPKLKSQGHRMLIFSTMTRALDVLEDYMTYEKIKYTRLDGSYSERERVRNIDAFNAPNSQLDVFLLSTRAGGVGINLATADTIIIWDSDFNPYADLQAISRAHRIGQTDMVLILRLMSRLTIEEKVLQIGKKKMALEHVVVERMKDEDDQPQDIESILKYGAEALFADDDSKDINYDSAALDSLLDREKYREAAIEKQQEEIRDAEEGKAKAAEQGMNFSFAKVWKADGSTEDLPSEEDETQEKNEGDFWEKFLKEKEIEAERKKEEKRLAAEQLGRGARKRAVVTYKESFKERSKDGGDGTFKFEEAAGSSSEDEEAEAVVEADSVLGQIQAQQAAQHSRFPLSLRINGPSPIAQQHESQQRVIQLQPAQPEQTQSQQQLLSPQYEEALYREMLQFQAPFLQRIKAVAEKAFKDNTHHTPVYSAVTKELYAELFKNVDNHFRTQFVSQYTRGQSNGIPQPILDNIYDSQLRLLNKHFVRLSTFIDTEMHNHFNYMSQRANLVRQQQEAAMADQLRRQEQARIEKENQLKQQQQDSQLKARQEAYLLQERRKQLQANLEAQLRAHEQQQAKIQADQRAQQQAQLQAQQQAQLQAQQQAQAQARQQAQFQAQQQVQQQAQQLARQQAEQRAQFEAQQQQAQQGQPEQLAVQLYEQPSPQPVSQPAVAPTPFLPPVMTPAMIMQMQEYLTKHQGQTINQLDFLRELTKLSSAQPPEEQRRAEEATAAAEEKHKREEAEQGRMKQMQQQLQQQRHQQPQQQYQPIQNYSSSPPQQQQFVKTPPIQYNTPPQQHSQQQDHHSHIQRNNAAFFQNVCPEMQRSFFNQPPSNPDPSVLDKSNQN